MVSTSGEAPAPIELGELKLLARAKSAADLAAMLGGWVLAGPRPREETESSEDWSFRTLSVKTVRDRVGGLDIVLEEHYVAYPLKKAKGGPFATTILIGRSMTNDVCIGHSSISKLHARVRVRPDGVLVLSDAGSSNGTTVGGQKLLAAQEVNLRTGDLVAFGACAFHALDPARLHLMLQRL